MKQTQVITIHPDGAVSGLQVKPGKGLDLTKLGKATVTRASEIVWDADAQAWYIHVLVGPQKGPVTFDRFQEALDGTDPDYCAAVATLRDLAPSGWGGSSYEISDPAFFDGSDYIIFTSYDEAVKAEIAFLDALRKRGLFTDQTE